MGTLAAYDPPGGLADLDLAGRTTWSNQISASIDRAIQGRTDQTNDAPRAQFFNLLKKDTASDAKTLDITWIAFPRQVKVSSVSDHQRWLKADQSRDVQDEYCEWSVTRDTTGKITRVAFTCEGPEYWDLLAQTQPDKVLALYRQCIDSAVQHDDLFDSKGQYIARNRWNTNTTTGAMHLVQGSNTLGAEIELAAAATIVRLINGQELMSEQELISCSRYGVAQRNSDPHIGGEVNGLARAKADVTLMNPVGLYFDDLSTQGWKAPDGSDPKSYWKYVRGTPDRPLRAVYEVPTTKSFTAGDVTINNQPIAFGAQIADFISMKLTGVACRFGQSTVQPMKACVGDAPSPRHTPLLAAR